MSFSTVLSAAIRGLQVEFVRVEADISNGLPMFHMVGYLSSEVKEASERVRTALHNSGIQLPAKKIVINLSPATVKKKGASFDLPIAVAVLASLGHIVDRNIRDTLVIGELSLDGKIREVPGILPIVAEAKKAGVCTCIVPKENAAEGTLVDGIEIIGTESLAEVYGYLTGELNIIPEEQEGRMEESCRKQENMPDFCDIYGQEAVKRAAEVAVSGGHNLLLIGPPGSGKSMIAKRIPGILPPTTFEESMEITQIYSIMGLVDKDRPLITERPFRSVHHTATKSALAGGGLVPVPGEISLAHEGVLFLDELAEFQKPVLEVLRQPLEEHVIRIARSHGSYVFPANFMLVAALNPCPCGHFPDMNKCTCTSWQVQQYMNKISQPFLDRIDICMEAPKVEYEALNSGKGGETSEEICKRVQRTRQIQRSRYRGTDIRSNALLNVSELETYCRLGREEEKLMKQAFTSMELTARTYHKIIRVARTIADMDCEEHIMGRHLKEAIGYRTMDKKYWGR